MKKKQTLSTVISSNPYNKSYFEGTTTHLDKAVKPKFIKTQYSISALKTNSFLTAQISISKNIDEEDYFDVIENKAYEELGLDIATEYNVHYYEDEEAQDEANRIFNVFIIDPHELREEFTPILDQIRYVDHIYPTPLLMRSLYKKEIIPENGIDCFIYFSDSDAFLTIYKDGEYLYTKELKFTLENIHELFCEIYGERVSYENFMALFIDEGLQTTNEENRSYLLKLFNELFSQINEVINYTKRAYELEDIKRIYIGTSAGVVKGMDELAQVTLGIESNEFDFEYGFETNEFYIDQIHQLLQLNAQLDTEDRYDINVSLFHRPPPFIKRESGKLIMMFAASLLVSSLYPLWNVGFTLFANIENSSLLQSKNTIHNERLIVEEQVKALTKKYNELNKKISSAANIQTIQYDVLTQIHTQKVQYPMKAKIISQLTKDLNKYHVKLSKISFSDETKKHIFKLELVSNTERSMTSLIEKLTKDNIKEYEVSVIEIAYNADEDYYTSSLKVELK